ncbi:helix-turn-helix domain-containing protein [Quadrisphaera sp. KR29]|uniref:helix-turn-helix domain-containing protein n=1 Tax=Quadrisphaera sp. KR29 TaxID=3461391 RepID=UPI00404451B1
MDHSDEVRAFLSSRRARITPDQAGVPLYGTRRRVSGLRREEVAQLAGVSTDYYARLEKGNLAGASEAVLSAIAGALSLNDVERSHLFHLAHAAGPGRGHQPRRRVQHLVRPSVQRILDSMTDTAAFLRTGRLDVLAFNDLGRALYAPAVSSTEGKGGSGREAARTGNVGSVVNLARFVFLDPAAQTFYRDWSRIAAEAVGNLRAQAGRDPQDPILRDLIGQLSMRSEAFAAQWAAADVRSYRSGTQLFHHPAAGELELSYDALDLPADPGQTVIAYSAAAGSEAQRRLTQLREVAGRCATDA